jgi:hypothetical protein
MEVNPYRKTTILLNRIYNRNNELDVLFKDWKSRQKKAYKKLMKKCYNRNGANNE